MHIDHNILTTEFDSANTDGLSVNIWFTIVQDPCYGKSCADQCAGNDLYAFDCEPIYDSNKVPTVPELMCKFTESTNNGVSANEFLSRLFANW